MPLPGRIKENQLPRGVLEHLHCWILLNYFSHFSFKILGIALVTHIFSSVPLRAPQQIFVNAPLTKSQHIYCNQILDEKFNSKQP